MFNYNQPATSEIKAQFWDRAACGDRHSSADQPLRALLWTGILADISASHVKVAVVVL